MMKHFLISAVLIFTTMLLSGCFVKSLHPTYLDASIIYDFDTYHMFQPLMKDGSPSKENPWNKHGTIIHTNKNGTESDRLKAVFFKVGKNTYLDVTPGSTSSEDASMFHLIPAHCLYKVVVKDDLFQLFPLRTRSLELALKRKGVSLSHLQQKEGSDEDLIITASPAEWKKFLETHGDRTGLFADDEPLLFRGSKDLPRQEMKNGANEVPKK